MSQSRCIPDALTEQQRKFAAEQHGLIFAFLNENRLAANEYYDIAALGYLRAVRRYMTDPQLQRYAFSTIAWWSMRQSIAAFLRAERRRQTAEQAYAESAYQPVCFSTDLDMKLILHDLAAASSPEQYAAAQLRLQGCTVAETARIQGTSPRRVKRLLKALYLAYMSLMSPESLKGKEF